MNQSRRGRIPAQGASILRWHFEDANRTSRITISGSSPAFWSMVAQIRCTGCRDSSVKEARRITAQTGHILALHELKQIRCTGRADSSRAYLDLRQPPETFDAFFRKWRFQQRGMPFFGICSFIGVYKIVSAFLTRRLRHSCSHQHRKRARELRH